MQFFPDHFRMVRLRVCAGQGLIGRKKSKELMGVAGDAAFLIYSIWLARPHDSREIPEREADEHSVLNGFLHIRKHPGNIKPFHFGLLSYVRPPSAMILLCNRFNFWKHHMKTATLFAFLLIVRVSRAVSCQGLNNRRQIFVRILVSCYR